MKEIKLYLDLEKIEKETGRKFDVEGEYSDNFVRWLQYLAWSGLDAGKSKNEKMFRKEKAKKLYKITQCVYSEWEVNHNKF